MIACRAYVLNPIPSATLSVRTKRAGSAHGAKCHRVELPHEVFKFDEAIDDNRTSAPAEFFVVPVSQNQSVESRVSADRFLWRDNQPPRLILKDNTAASAALRVSINAALVNWTWRSVAIHKVDVNQAIATVAIALIPLP